MFKSIIVFLTIFLQLLYLIYAFEKEIIVNVEPGKEDCFYESVKKGNFIDIEYQVTNAGHGDFDITFHLIEPHGRILAADIKKSGYGHRIEALDSGDYKFCFDNTFSLYNSKTVFFELIIENSQEKTDTNNDVIFDNTDYDFNVENLFESLNQVKDNLSKTRHFQEILKSIEAKDRNTAEENYFKVNTLSIIQIMIMLLVGIIQVIMVKSLFCDTYKPTYKY